MNDTSATVNEGELPERKRADTCDSQSAAERHDARVDAVDVAGGTAGDAVVRRDSHRRSGNKHVIARARAELDVSIDVDDGAARALDALTAGSRLHLEALDIPRGRMATRRKA